MPHYDDSSRNKEDRNQTSETGGTSDIQSFFKSKKMQMTNGNPPIFRQINLLNINSPNDPPNVTALTNPLTIAITRLNSNKG